MSQPGPGYLGDAFPTFSPDGRDVLFVATEETADIMMLDLPR